MTMHFWDAYWGLRVKECPCDVHFVDWLRSTGVKGATIYHFGSGGHHIVGVEREDEAAAGMRDTEVARGAEALVALRQQAEVIALPHGFQHAVLLA